MAKRTLESKSVERGGKRVSCPHCGGDQFWQRESLLSTKVASILSMEALNPATDCYICVQCRRIEWFLGERERL